MTNNSEKYERTQQGNLLGGWWAMSSHTYDKGRKACVDFGTHRHCRGERFELRPIATSGAGTRGQAGSQTCASAIVLSEAIASHGDIN